MCCKRLKSLVVIFSHFQSTILLACILAPVSKACPLSCLPLCRYRHLHSLPLHKSRKTIYSSTCTYQHLHRYSMMQKKNLKQLHINMLICICLFHFTSAIMMTHNFLFIIEFWWKKRERIENRGTIIASAKFSLAGLEVIIVERECLDWCLPASQCLQQSQEKCLIPATENTWCLRKRRTRALYWHSTETRRSPVSLQYGLHLSSLTSWVNDKVTDKSSDYTQMV